MHSITSGKWEVGTNDDAPPWVATVWAGREVIASLCHHKGRSAHSESLHEIHANAELIALAPEYYAALLGMTESTTANADSIKRAQLLASELVSFAVRSNADMHSPGPWFVSPAAHPRFRRDVCNKFGAIASCTQQRGELAEVEANANVMAMAPQMLRALKAIVTLDAGEDSDPASAIRALAAGALPPDPAMQQSPTAASGTRLGGLAL
jgi:hypothetical protein